MRSDITKFLAVATSQIGTVEVPRGSNKGKQVEAYLAVTGLDGGYPWCAACVAWCGVQALGNLWPLQRTADCDVLLSQARKLDILHGSPQVGDVFLVMASKNDATHTGIVVAVNSNGTIVTIEGNSNSDGAREGYAVVKNPARIIARSGRLPLQFIRWAELVEDADNPWTVRMADESKPFVTAEIVNGRPYLPARALLTKVLKGTAAIAGRLSYDAEDNALLWDGKPVATQVLLREGTAWAAVRPLLEGIGKTVEADATHRTIIVS